METSVPGTPTSKRSAAIRYNDGTKIVWQQGSVNFHDYQDLIDEVDETCARVMSAVFAHITPGTLRRVRSEVL